MAIDESLEALFVANPDFEEIERSRSIFCPFEAIGMVRQEIRHSHFLAYCLDPRRPHGFGSEGLKALLRAAAYAQRPDERQLMTALDVHLMDFEGAQIRREWRSIDLVAVISDEKLVVAIELKIDASEHSGQLARYRQTVESEWPISDGWRHLLLFLTKNGDDPSDIDGSGWLSVRLEAVVRELGEIERRKVGNPEARSLLISYLAMLRRHHLTDERLEQLAVKLWGQHREALEFLMERRPDNGTGVVSELYKRRDEIAARLTEAAAQTVLVDDCTPGTLRFAVESWDHFPDFRSAEGWTSSNRLVLLEMRSSNDRQRIRIRFVLGPGPQSARQRVHEALVSAGVPVGARKAITPSFTRLATKNIVEGLDAEDADVGALTSKALSEIAVYGKSFIPQYHAALTASAAAQPPVSQTP